jgi:hypothetical protein
MISCGCQADEACSGGKCGCFSAQLSCTKFGVCQRSDDIACHNKWTKTAAEYVDGNVDESDAEDDADDIRDI